MTPAGTPMSTAITMAETRQQQRGLDALQDGLGHRPAQEDRLAEVALQQAPVPVHELHRQRRVEAELALERCDVVAAWRPARR